ncbi:tetratricopeptide repeat protein [Bradyrhizobium arachidis]|uniref:tetratricopeptide repeat protein n=1 Tax=Bradyrhizobium arachidis TaxID=858423 RepID=UPI0021632B3C|nr:tetratricopeptide repeat protein [Bradyrhizobium arachidis]UVO30142.1 tetratricopeptide repeat protein [Bradyrhizobium arachidis]
MSRLRRWILATALTLVASHGNGQQTADSAIEQARQLLDRGAYGASLSALDSIPASTALSQTERRSIATIRAEDLFGQGKFDDAVAPAQTALDASDGLSKQDMADALFLVAKVAVAGDGSPTEALERALKAAVEADGPDGLRALRVKDRVALVMSTSSAAEAEQMMRDVIANADRLPDNFARDKLRFGNTLGIALLRETKFDAAREVLSPVYDGRVKLLSKSHPETLESEHTLGYVLRRLGRTQEADDLLTEALRLRIQVLGSDHPDTLVTRTIIVRQLLDKSKFDQALNESRAITAALTARLGEKNVRTIEAMSDLADALSRSGRVSEGIETSKRVYSLAVEAIGETKPETMNVGHQYAGLLYQSGRYGEALSLFQRILRATSAQVGDDNIDTIATLHNIAAVLSDLGRNDEAIEIYRYSASVLAN